MIKTYRKRLAKTKRFSNHGIIKFILLLQKSVYPCEYNGMIGKNSMKLHYKKKKMVTKTWKMQITHTTKQN